uniref:Uncharacterized protein n=1 Tax=Lotus japonicus TaxID=34305 RepID=I3SIQ3_LOTJA|nr:unknown [Lotus japonicus]
MFIILNICNKHLKRAIFNNTWARDASDNGFKQWSKVFCKIFSRQPCFPFYTTCIYYLKVTLLICGI